MSAEDAPRKRLTLFYGRDGVPLGEDRMPMEGMTEAVLKGVAKFAEANIKEGLGERATVLFAEPGEEGMSLVHGWFKSGYMLPPHSHSTDCLYYVVAGELRMGKHVLKKGDGVFIPGGHGYGYEAGPEGVEVLEFRNATRFNIVLQGVAESRWEQMAANYTARSPDWETEKPPSER
jgi:quercetin dioxygenase-like cupin family protein